MKSAGSVLVAAELLRFAREMRKDSAPAEKIVWACLRDRQLCGFKFRRQHRSPPFIADFYCHQVQLIVELDGDSHDGRAEYDAARTKRFMRDGMQVIRFENSDVFDHLELVLDEIARVCQELAAEREPSP